MAGVHNLFILNSMQYFTRNNKIIPCVFCVIIEMHTHTLTCILHFILRLMMFINSEKLTIFFPLFLL